MTSNYQHFADRKVQIVGISVDDSEFMERFSVRDGIPYPLLGDPEMRIIDNFKIRNPEIALAIHSTYLADKDGVIYYRKVGRRRPLPGEILDAIDYHHGNWPRPALEVTESEITGYHISVAQALIESFGQQRYPTGLNSEDKATVELLRKRFGEEEWDPALKIWTEWQAASGERNWAEIIRYFTWDQYLSNNPSLQNFTLEIKALDPKERTPRRVRQLMRRKLTAEERDQVFLLRALVSILDDITEATRRNREGT